MEQLDAIRDRLDLSGVRVVYTDLDGTLLGPGGNLFAAAEGTSGHAASALAALHRAEVELVLVSGRTRDGLREPARVLGAGAYVAELGAFTVDRSTEQGGAVLRDFGGYVGAGSPHGAMIRQGAGAFLLDRYPGRLELHARAAAHRREATMLFRGLIDPSEATSALEDAGYGWLAVHDNGIIRRATPALEVPQVRAYHLAPRGISKASGVRAHRERRELPAASAIAIGDSPSDLTVAAEVRAMFVVANGLPSLEGIPVPQNVYATRSTLGDGFAEVVEAVLGPSARSAPTGRRS